MKEEEMIELKYARVPMRKTWEGNWVTGFAGSCSRDLAWGYLVDVVANPKAAIEKDAREYASRNYSTENEFIRAAIAAAFTAGFEHSRTRETK